MHRRFVTMRGEDGGRVTISRPSLDRWWRSPDCVPAARLARPAGYSPATDAEARDHRRRSLARVLATMAILWAAVGAVLAILWALVPA
ncbi:hypothetical protein OJF2_74660 [Aquisphaera giovannonii]|uniref:Uncharacterized protein n=1 Tax=Aquisphaera giovannonii TaxID=406548 RepID=A0A5B9WDZ0_9BACT|nr:hypothetical protein [Aquisphaera giovannonii]QEH38856.1 hypothetical protein OJF2_74660 [Aquisphaera giovannonii]